MTFAGTKKLAKGLRTGPLGERSRSSSKSLSDQAACQGALASSPEPTGDGGSRSCALSMARGRLASSPEPTGDGGKASSISIPASSSEPTGNGGDDKNRAAAVLRRYLFKLYLNKAQSAALHEQRQMMADLWNALLQRYEDTYRRAASEPQRFEHWRDPQGIVYVFAPRCPDAEKELKAAGWEIVKKVKCSPSIHAEGKRSLSYKGDTSYEITALLAECREWRELSTWSPRQVAIKLQASFDAFFRRAKAGAGAASGYPKFHARKRSTTIPHRFASGCKMLPAGCKRSDAAEKAGTARTWVLTLKAVPGHIRARGRFPSAPLAWKDADVIFRDGSWWISVCVEMPAKKTDQDVDRIPVTVRFDLVDEFARVERAEGPRRACEESARALAQNPSGLHTLEGGCENPDHAAGNGRGFDRSGARRKNSQGENPDHAAGNGRESADGRISVAMRSAAELCERADAIKSARDLRWPAHSKRSWRNRRETERAARLTTRASRIRREALHVWSSAIVAGSSDLTVIMPALKEATASPRGDAKNWGANVETVSKLNRAVLNQAPALAASMLSYKAQELGIRCDVVRDEAAPVAIGGALVAAGKITRRAKKALERMAS